MTRDTAALGKMYFACLFALRFGCKCGNMQKHSEWSTNRLRSSSALLSMYLQNCSCTASHTSSGDTTTEPCVAHAISNAE